MADLVITTDYSQVNDLNNALKSTDTIFVKAVDSIVRESNRFNRVNKILAKTTEETLAVVSKAEEIVAAKIQKETDKREKARKREADAAEREAKRIEAAAKKAADAEAKVIAAQEAAAQKAAQKSATNRAETAFSLGMQKAGEIAKQEQEIERLRQKYDKIYAASRLYESSLEELNRAHMLGVTSVKQHEAAVEQLNMEYQQFASSAEGAYIANNRFSQHMNETGRGLNNFGFVAQQVGYQVGDFFVQVQSGTNAFVAFGQQATQLAGLIPGIGGAIAGIGISIATAFLSAYTRTSEAVEEAKNYKTVLEDISNATQDLTLQRLSPGFEVDSQRKAVISEIAQLETDIFLKKQEQADQDAGFIALSNEEIRLIQTKIDKLREKLVAYEEENKKLQDAKKHLEDIKTLTYQSLGGLTSITQLDLSKIFSNALPAAQNFFDKIKEIAGAYAKYGPSGVIPGTAIPRGKFTEDGMTNAARGVMNDRPSPFGTLASGAGGVRVYPNAGNNGGSGGPSQTTMENKLEEVYKYLELDKYQIEQEKIAFEQRQNILQTALEKKLITQQEYNQLELDLASKHAKDIADIENKAKVQKLSTVLGTGEQILQAVGQQNEKAAKMARVFGAAQALADTYAGAAAALKLPFPANLAAAGSIISAGLGFVAAIRSGSTSAKSSGGGVGSATVAASASAPAPQTVFIDSISPESLYSGETLIKLFDSFYDENDKRGKVFMVAR